MFKTYIFAVSVNLEMDKFKFKPASYSSEAQWILFGFLGLVVLGIIIGTVYFLRHKRQAEEFNRIREEARIRLLLSEFNLDQDDRKLFEVFTDSKSPGRYIPLLESKTVFEESIKRFKANFPDHPALKQVAKLRQRLGYGFSNVRTPFQDTRMLAAGTRLQCKVPGVKQDISFLTTIMTTNEGHFFIRPPTSKKKPVLFKQIPNMTFRVTRGDDAEYEFICNVVGQMQEGLKAIMVDHTEDIQKLMFRNAPRRTVDLETRFFVVKKEVVSSRGHSNFKASESQFAFQGNIRDLSIGGSLLVTPASKQNPVVGDMLVFHIPAAQINEDLIAEVVRLTDLPDNHLQVHLRFEGMKEINRLKMNKFLEAMEEEFNKKKAESATTPASG